MGNKQVSFEYNAPLYRRVKALNFLTLAPGGSLHPFRALPAHAVDLLVFVHEDLPAPFTPHVLPLVCFVVVYILLWRMPIERPLVFLNLETPHALASKTASPAGPI